MCKVNDISFSKDVSLRTSVSSKYNYCNIDYNTRKKHLKTGDALDKSKQLSAFNRRQFKRNITTKSNKVLYQFIDNNTKQVVKVGYDKNVLSISHQLRKNNIDFIITIV